MWGHTQVGISESGSRTRFIYMLLRETPSSNIHCCVSVMRYCRSLLLTRRWLCRYRSFRVPILRILSLLILHRGQGHFAKYFKHA